jgi:hypothetical protein
MQTIIVMESQFAAAASSRRVSLPADGAFNTSSVGYVDRMLDIRL